MKLRLVLAGNGLDPAERLRDLPADVKADPVAGMARRAPLAHRGTHARVMHTCGATRIERNSFTKSSVS